MQRSLKCREVFFLHDMSPGPVFMKILVLRVAPSNKILRKFLEMWVFPLKFKEKILSKEKRNSESLLTLKEVLRSEIVRSTDEDF